MIINSEQMVIKKPESRRGLSLLEMTVVLLITGIILTIMLPVMTSISRVFTQKNISAVNCISQEAASVTFPFDISSTSLSSACKTAINNCANNSYNSCNTIKSFKDSNDDTKKLAAYKMLRASCDLGGEEACSFFVEECAGSNDQCNLTGSYDDLDLNYYLTLAKSSNSVGRERIIEEAINYYKDGNTNLSSYVKSSCSSGNDAACAVVCTRGVSMDSCKTSCGSGSSAACDHLATNCAIGDAESCIGIKKECGDNNNSTACSVMHGYCGENVYLCTALADIIGALYPQYTFMHDLCVGGSTVACNAIKASCFTNQYYPACNMMYDLGLELSPIAKQYNNDSADTVRSTAIDSGGNILLMSSNGTYTYVTKLDNNGIPVWQNKFSNIQGILNFSLDVGPSDDIYIAATQQKDTIASSTPTTAMVIKLNSAGAVQWKKAYYSYDTAASSVDAATAARKIKVSGNYSYVTGTITPTATGKSDVLLFKIQNSDGALQWMNKYGASAQNDIGQDIALDTTGNVYVSGNQTSTGSNYNPFVMKVPADGSSVTWQDTFSDTASASAVWTQVRLDSNDNVYLMCYRPNGVFISKIPNSGGSTTWMKIYGLSSGVYSASGLSIDSSNHLYISGSQTADRKFGYSIDGSYSTYTATSAGFVFKLDSDSKLLWLRKFGGYAGAIGSYGAQTVDSAGNLYIADTTNYSGSFSGYDMFILRFVADATKVSNMKYMDGTGYYAVEELSNTFSFSSMSSATFVFTPLTTSNFLSTDLSDTNFTPTDSISALSYKTFSNDTFYGVLSEY